MHDVNVRQYMRRDRLGCLKVFETNVPQFFAHNERDMFNDFLDGAVSEQPYLVLVDGAEVIACGGLKILERDKSVYLSWGMVARPYHGRGIGRMLTEARLKLVRKTPGIEKITLNTSQHTKGFYEKFGFEAVKTTPDGYGPGLDRWDMELQVT